MTVEVMRDFSYETLEVEARVVVQQRTGEIKSLIRRSAQDTIEIGQKLLEVKSRLGHGLFGDWLRTEFDWSERLARQYMLVADKMAKFANLDTIAPSALYLLASSSTPDEVKEEFLEQAEAGEPVTHKQVKIALYSAKSHNAASKLAPGEQYTVTEKESPYYGQSVKVERSEGEFVYCETPDGKTQPFLPGWVGEQPSEKVKPEPKVDQKTELLVSLEFKVDVKEERIKLLEAWIRRALDEGELPQDLYQEGLDLLA
ncbi:MAG: DUF3102 domain-containing protein [Myxacorys californica WJT36-NPBG1]|jgi:hypothetical protein|nr:DUF3102 domain-containing protein [Myxacorys californica WJT36-NPBG1]